MKLLLLLGGECPRPKLVRRIAASVQGVLCADGGLRHAVRLEIKPRFVIGDMDSLPKPLPRWKNVVYLCDFDENSSDFEKALRFAAQGAKQDLYVSGVFGGRPDHVLVNLSLIERYSKKMRITVVDQGLARIAGPGRYEFRCRRGQAFSLLALSPSVTLSASGLRYPLRRRILRPGSAGLSNSAVSERATIRIHKGRAWIIIL